MDSPVGWVGTESGLPGGREIWSVPPGAGSGAGGSWMPVACDTTLQIGDTWFIEPGMPIRTLKDLTDVYHQTVGRNGVLEMDFAIDRTGRVAPKHAARYKEFGDWVKSCCESWNRLFFSAFRSYFLSSKRCALLWHSAPQTAPQRAAQLSSA